MENKQLHLDKEPLPKLRGKVTKFFSPQKPAFSGKSGFGFIALENGQEVYFNYRNIVGLPILSDSDIKPEMFGEGFEVEVEIQNFKGKDSASKVERVIDIEAKEKLKDLLETINLPRIYKVDEPPNLLKGFKSLDSSPKDLLSDWEEYIKKHYKSTRIVKLNSEVFKDSKDKTGYLVGNLKYWGSEYYDSNEIAETLYVIDQFGKLTTYGTISDDDFRIVKE